MKMTLSEMQEMNKIQLEIFRQFVSVCDELDLKYYMVHGSLLGTIRFNGFFPFDDDIDVAMPRKDFDRLILEGQKLFGEGMFVQSYLSESDYPLPFAKIRNSGTSFIQPILEKLDINKGIYIDVFPIDYYPKSKLKKTMIRVRSIFLNARISCRMNYSYRRPIKKRIVQMISRLIIPSYKMAVRHRAELYSKTSEQDQVIVYGGKTLEKGIPQKWFGKGRTAAFENLAIVCPEYAEEYLSCIYGNYLTYDPSAKYMHGDTVEVSADYVSCTIPYTEYKGVKG